MLTLQQILESDSIASLVAKLNSNFLTVSNSNGGPQGIRGPQGIPGLPGRLGPIGPTGPQGIAAPAVGIIPYAATVGGITAVGPDPGQIAPNGQPVEPWPISSWVWLMYYHGAGVSTTNFPAGITAAGATAQHGDIFIDHANSGYWKYLNTVDIEGAGNSPSPVTPPYSGYTSGGYYKPSNLLTYPDFTAGTAEWVGEGWYYYPSQLANANAGDVWINDYTTYLVGTPAGPYATGPFQTDAVSPLTVANARLLSKYGTIWITSGSDGTTAGNVGDENSQTTEIGKEWLTPPNLLAVSRPGRINAGVDRLLFKMSLDTIPYSNNITARGFAGSIRGGNTGFAAAAAPNFTFPQDSSGDPLYDYEYWIKPQYEVTMDKYTPLLFLSERDPEDYNYGNYSSIGLYMHTAKDAGYAGLTGHTGSAPEVTEGEHKSIFVWSTRSAPDPIEMFNPAKTPVVSVDTQNFGEFLMDFRRLITSNQYVCSVPADMRLSSDYVVIDGVIGDYYEENTSSNVLTPGAANEYGDPYSNAFRTYQGYISAINSKSLTGVDQAVDYWEYGLGDQTTFGQNQGTHDTSSSQLGGMSTRQSWYGSAVMDKQPSDWETNTVPGTNNYIRIAGMQERGRRFTNVDPAVGPTGTHFLSELVFYTSHFNADLGLSPAVTNGIIDPTINQHKNRPVFYASPYRNLGIGTFVGTFDAATDQGPAEPAARFHVHVKENSREDDPTYTWVDIGQGAGLFASRLPSEVFAAAAFSGDYGAINLQYVTDILLGNLSTPNVELVNPTTGLEPDVVNAMQVPGTSNVLRNAIRTESWRTKRLNTMHLGAQPLSIDVAIGRSAPEAFRNEFQLSFHPLTADASGLTGTMISESLRAITGIGVHNLYPRSRSHFYGKNLYNETEFGMEYVYPSYVINNSLSAGLTAGFPYYGATANNQPSANQVVIDYIGDSYTYPLGMYEYQYYSYGATGAPGSTGSYSPNAAVYPNRDAVSPTRHAVPYYGGIYGAVTSAYPSTAPIPYNGSYRHGGTANAIWEPTSYVGFNLVRDLSAAEDPSDPNSTNLNGDSKTDTRWFLGTQGNNSLGNGNNGGAAIMFSPHGELGIVTIPRGFDGGRAYEQWEQRGLSTRDVLNQMKLIVDKYGNLAVGNAAGWDLDAYPSMNQNMVTGTLNYVPLTNPLTTGPLSAATGGSTAYNIGYLGGVGQYGRVNYPSNPDSGTVSNAALINKRATTKEYIRLEVAAEKAWSREGRELQKVGYGYPANTPISITGTDASKYIKLNAGYTVNTFAFITDIEGRIISCSFAVTKAAIPATLTVTNIEAIVFPHPREFNTGAPLNVYAGSPSFSAPEGALAAEWWGMSTDTPADLLSDTVVIQSTGGLTWLVNPIPTTDTRGSANLRLNNFVYGEGYGFGTTAGQLPGLSGPIPNVLATYTQRAVRQKRQESPKLVFTFLERTPISRPNTGIDPYKKVSTVVQSAQNEASLREYWIPKSDNTGGTVMVFTDHMGSKEYQSGFDQQLTGITGITGGATGGFTANGSFNNLFLHQVVTMEEARQYFTYNNTYLPDYKIENAYDNALQTLGPLGVTGFAPYSSMAFINYFNKLQYTGYGYTSYFANTEWGEVVANAAPTPSGITSGSSPYAIGVPLGNTGAFPIGYYPSGLTGTTALGVANGCQGISVRRNVDKFYSIMPGSTANYDGGWNNTDFDNRATEIRFKRINSEYVLVDFNITVRVDNPILPEGTGSGTLQDNDYYIDFKSPRMTQYMSFIYKPNLDDDDDVTKGPDFTENTYGNGPWFSEWSSYKKWNPGSAVVGGDTHAPNWDSAFAGLRPPIGPGQADNPFFVDYGTANGGYRTWNGNFIDYGAYAFGNLFISPILGYGNWGPGGGTVPTAVFEVATDNPIRPGYSAALINAWLSASLINATPSSDSFFFNQYMSKFYSVWGNQFMSRTRTMNWRISPTRWEEISGNQGGADTNVNNAFTLEVMFDVPIIHCDHVMEDEVFTGGNPPTNYRPYQYLTVSGQSILRYGRTRPSAGGGIGG